MHVRTRTWFAVVVVAAALFLAGSRLGIFEPLENAVLSIAAPIESGLRSATRPAADFVNNLTDINRLSDENQSLQDDIAQLTAEVARLQEVESENRDLRQLLGIRETRPEDTFVSANVFAREPNNLQDRIAIDRGRADGLRVGMVVVTRQGSLVGFITSILDDVAWVTVITDQTSGVSAVIQASRVQGVVVGAANGTLTMEFVEETADVKEGDLVLTSGIGGRHPPGLPIGQVVQVEQTAQELFQEVRVEPVADLGRLEKVLVLDSFLPLETGEP